MICIAFSSRSIFSSSSRILSSSIRLFSLLRARTLFSIANLPCKFIAWLFSLHGVIEVKRSISSAPLEENDRSALARGTDEEEGWQLKSSGVGEFVIASTACVPWTLFICSFRFDRRGNPLLWREHNGLGQNTCCTRRPWFEYP